MDFSFFITENKSGYKTTEKWLSKNRPELYNKIINYCIRIPLELSFKEKIWFFYNNIKERPKCITCNCEIKFRDRLDKPYGEFCSIKCLNTNKEEMVRRQNKTFNEKYGLDFYTKHPDFILKQRETKKNKYGDENFNNHEKSKVTRKLKYGNENYNNLNKQKNTILNRYGAENISKTNYYQKKVIDKFKQNYVGLNILSLNKQLVKIKCIKCDTVYEIHKQLLYERYKRNYEICTTCSPIGFKSQSGIENEINDYINSLGIDTTQSYKVLPNNLEIDIYIPEKKIGVELNGIYWHNELFKGEDYHLNKLKLSKELGIELIQIFEDEWLYKKDIVKSILRNKLGRIDNKIFSRKCSVKEISSKVCNKFLEENHIQDKINSKIRLGLFYNNDLCSVMTFSNGRIIMGGKKDEWELTRFCNKKNFVVVGAASKLLSFFLKKYMPEKLISYSDSRWFDGKMYDKLGFKKISESKPNYWYVVGNLRQHRFNFRKSILISQGYDKNKTEKQIMFERKIYRIYDCGNIRWEYSL